MLRFIKFNLLLLSLPLALIGQDAPKTHTLTLLEVISLALDRNLLLERSGIQVQLGENEVESEKADFRPNLTASAGISTRYTADGRDPVWDDGSFTDSASGSLNSSVTLYRGDQQKASLEQAMSSLEASRKDLDRSQQQILFQSVARFHGFKARSDRCAETRVEPVDIFG
jgi:outer membrane protein TolC